MKLLINGTLYDYDTTKTLMTEALEMEQRTGMGLISFELAFQDFKPTALKWMAYLALQRAGEKPDWDSLEVDLNEMCGHLVNDVFGKTDDAVDPTKPVSPTSETDGDEPRPASTVPTT